MAAQMNPDLRRERKGASFDVRSMTYLLDGGAEETAKRQRYQKLVADEPVFANNDKYFLSRVQNYERVLHKVVRGIQMCIEHNISPEDAEYLFHFAGEEFMIGLHWSMFIPTLQGQATADQVPRIHPSAAAWIRIAVGWRGVTIGPFLDQFLHYA